MLSHDDKECYFKVHDSTLLIQRVRTKTENDKYTIHFFRSKQCSFMSIYSYPSASMKKKRMKK